MPILFTLRYNTGMTKTTHWTSYAFTGLLTLTVGLSGLIPTLNRTPISRHQSFPSEKIQLEKGWALYRTTQHAPYQAPVCAPETTTQAANFDLPWKSRFRSGFTHAAVAVLPVKTPLKNGDITIQMLYPTGAQNEQVSQIAIEFDQDITPLGSNAPIPATIIPAHPGAWRWANARRLLFEGETPFFNGLRSQVWIDKSLTLHQKQKLASDISWEFDTLRPGCVELKKESAWDKTDLKPVLGLRFNQLMNPKSVVNATAIEVMGNGQIQAMKTVLAPNRNQPDTPTDTVWIQPHIALGLNMTAEVVVKPGIPACPPVKSTGHVLTTDSGRRLFFSTYGPPGFRGISGEQFEDTDVNPDTTLQLQFRTPVHRADVEAALCLIPHLKTPVKLLPDQTDVNTVFTVKMDTLAPSQNLVLVFRHPITDVYGQTFLPAPYPLSLGHFYPQFAGPNGVILREPLEKNPSLQFALFNYNQLEIGARACTTPQELGQALTAITKSATGLTDFAPAKPLKLEAKPDVWQHFRFSLQPFIDSHPGAPIYVRWRIAGKLDWHQTLVLITNVGLTAKLGNTDGLIWATHLTEGTPYEGVAITGRMPDGRVLFSGTTDTDGLFKLPDLDTLWQSGINRTDILITGAIGSQQGLVAMDWDQGLSREDFQIHDALKETHQIPGNQFEYRAQESSHFYGPGIGYGWSDYQGIRAWAMTDRPLYQPGETLQFKAIFRKPGRGIVQLLNAGTPIEVTLTGPENTVTLKKTWQMSAFSTLTGQFTIPANAVSGDWFMSWKTPDNKESGYLDSVYVGMIQKKNMALSVTPVTDNVVAGDRITFKVSGTYLNGGVMKKHKISYTLNRNPAWLGHDAFPGYVFNYTDPYQEAENWYDYSYSEVKKDKGILDKSGQSVVAWDSEKSPRPMNISASVTVYDYLNNALNTAASVTVHPADLYIGVLAPKTLIPARMPTTIAAIAVSARDQLKPSQKIEAVLYRKERDTVREKNTGETFGYATKTRLEKEKTWSVTVTPTSRAITFTPRKAGDYVLVLTGNDQRGRQNQSSTAFTVYGPTEVEWQRYDHDRIDMIPDKPMYTPGETAKILLKSPFESGYMLITTEREGVMSVRTQAFTGKSPVIEIPMTESCFPNIYVSVTMVQGRIRPKVDGQVDLGKPSFRLGYTMLRMSDAPYRLSVTAKPDRARYQPNDRVTIHLKALNLAGLPVSADIAIAVMDEAVYQLRPVILDPYSTFFSERPQSVAHAESRVHFFGQRTYGEKGLPIVGGGGLSEETLRRFFANTAYWNPSVLTGPNGEARVSFKLPDNLTTFRILVMAQTRDNKFGHAMHTFVVQKPVSLFPILPKFLIIGDTWTGGVEVHNQSGTSGVAEVTAQSQGATLASRALVTSRIKNETVAHLDFRYVTGKVTQAVFRFRARLNQFSDGLQITIPVYDSEVAEVSADYGQFTGSIIKRIAWPAATDYHAGKLTVRVSNSVVNDLPILIDRLLDYPHHCLEQQYAIATAYAAIAAMPDKTGSRMSTKTARAFTQKTINQTAEYFKTDNGLSFWGTSQSSSDPWLTLYIGEMLIRFERLGYSVPANYFSKIDTYAHNLFDQEVSAIRKHSKEISNGQALRAWHYLAYRNQLLPSEIERVQTVFSVNSLLDQTVLADAASRIPALRPWSRKLLTEAQKHRVFTGSEIWLSDPKSTRFSYMISTDAEANLYGLEALIALDPKSRDIAPIMRRLITQAVRKRYTNTHESARVIMAALDYAKHYEAAAPKTDVTIAPGHAKPSRLTLSAAHPLGEWQQSFALKPGQKSASGPPLNLDLQTTGTRPVFYNLERIVYRPAPTEPVNAGLSVSRRIVNTRGHAVTDTLKQGELYRVEITLKTGVNRDFLVIQDFLPAGAQSLDPRIGNGWQVIEEAFGKNAPQLYNWWMSYQDYREDRTAVYCQDLKAGTYTWSYVMRALIPGEYTMRPVQAEEMYAPEIRGMGPVAKIRIL